MTPNMPRDLPDTELRILNESFDSLNLNSDLNIITVDAVTDRGNVYVRQQWTFCGQ